MEIEVLKFDNLGRGIGYYNDKIIFIPKAVPGDTLLVEITQDKKKYYEGKILQILKPAKLRVEPVCPYFSTCGGCDLMQISLSNSLEYKLNKLNELFKHQQIDYEVKEIIKSHKQYNYRNKVTLKIQDGKIGFYASGSHQIVAINSCYLVLEEINKLIKELKILNIQNGEIIIRVNYNNEVLLIINTKDKVENLDVFNKKFKLAGVILNSKLIYGSSFLIDKIGDYLFKISYDAFFQVNPSICLELVKLINNYTSSSKKVLDLYCGVGLLSIAACKNAEVLGVEINENAILDARFNCNLNNIKKAKFICADTKQILEKITKDYDTIILDPPRSGVDSNVLTKIMQENISKIIYVSCNPLTLVRDLKILLTQYKIESCKLLDMFVNTEHVETIVVLKAN